MKKTEYFKLFSHNISVKGKEKSAIYNLQRSGVKYIPNSLHEILQKMENQSIQEIREEIADEEKEIFDSYVDFLLISDFGFVTNNPEEYPKMPMQWKSPNKINVTVIEYDCTTAKYNLEDVFQQLDNLLCPHLEMRLKIRNFSDLEEISKLTEGLVFRSIGLFIEYEASLKNKIDTLFHNNEKLEYIIIYNSPEIYYSEQFPERINYIQEDIYEHLTHQRFPQNNYIVSVKYFTEAQQFHTYYNKRICIDWNGNIKNCLLHTKKFGNINEVELQDVISNPEFTELWFIHPDKVIDYKDDEMRYCKFYTEKLEKIDDYYYKVVS